MDKNKKIKVISQIDGHVGVYLPNLNFSREWLAKGQIVNIPYEILEEAMFDPGFKNMIDLGILFIDDLDSAKELGLEDETVEVATNYKSYNELELKNLINKASNEDFETELKKMPKEFSHQLAEWAITLRLRDDTKIQLLKKYTGIDIDKGINLSKALEDK